jgi:hypothetical protein
LTPHERLAGPASGAVLGNVAKLATLIAPGGGRPVGVRR